MEAALPSAKRSRRDASGTNPPQLDAADSGEAPCLGILLVEPEQSRGQEPAPPEAGGDGSGGEAVDRISGLPDAILGEVISLLSTKEAGRTQVLASRWRHVWNSAPLNLDCGGFDTLNQAEFSGVVWHILSNHRGPGRRFRVPAHFIHNVRDTVDEWLRSPALDNLQDIDFCHRILDPMVQDPLPPPASLFRFSRSLRVATIGKCHIPDRLAETLRFPELRYLGIENLRISEAALHSLISCCPVLECLFLKESFGFRCIRINSSCLRSIGVGSERYRRSWPQLEELIIENAPRLEKLLYAERFGLRLSVIAAPKLATLGCLSDKDWRSRVLFGDTVFQALLAECLTTVVRNVKILALNLRIFNLDKVIDLMKCFPCLEKLYMKSCHSTLENLWRRKHRLFIKGFDIRLKTIVLENYRGIKGQLSFASFFVLNAKELEVLRLEVEIKNCNDQFFAQQHVALQMEKRASSSARLDFTTHRCHNDLLPIKHVCDLSVTDPYQCRC